MILTRGFSVESNFSGGVGVRYFWKEVISEVVVGCDIRIISWNFSYRFFNLDFIVLFWEMGFFYFGAILER